MLLSTNRKALFLGLAALLLFCRCGDDSTPFGPEILAVSELAFFPLREGYQADYTYYLSVVNSRDVSMDDPGQNRGCRKDGRFHLEVTDTYTKAAEKLVFYKIKTSLSLTADYCYDAYNPADTTWGEGVDSVTTEEYYLMLKNGALWYVENAPSFERLEEGDTTLMLAAPIGQGGTINLQLLPIGALAGAKAWDYGSDLDSLGTYFINIPCGGMTCSLSKNKGIEKAAYVYSFVGFSDHVNHVESIVLIQ